MVGTRAGAVVKLADVLPQGWSRLDQVAYFLVSILATTSSKRCSAAYLENLVIGSADDVGEDISLEEYRAAFVVAEQRGLIVVEDEGWPIDVRPEQRRPSPLRSTDKSPWVRVNEERAPKGGGLREMLAAAMPPSERSEARDGR